MKTATQSRSSSSHILEEQQGNPLFPVFLKLEEMSLLIVGGGPVALEKLQSVVTNSPATQVVLVAPEILPEIHALAENSDNIFVQEREFDPEDLDDADLVIAAVDHTVSEFVVIEAHKRNLLVHVADTPALSDFHLSPLVREGELKIAVSPNGKTSTPAKHTRRKYIRNGIIYALAGVSLMILGHLLFSYIPLESIGSAATGILAEVDSEILLWIAGGLIAGFIDGALGMGYGVTATTFLMSFGISPAVASMSVHSSEIFTSGVSGLTHLRFGNVNTKLFRNILIPGVLGAILGAYVLASFEDYNRFINPLVACYTLFLGVVIIAKALKRDKVRKKIKRLFPLAITGGFLDSVGGGGWGPIVSSTLISWGKTPRFIIGSVNLAEFFVALASSFTFATLLGLQHWQIIVGLIIGGAISSPIAATFARKLNARTMMLLVGIVVIIISIRNAVKVFF